MFAFEIKVVVIGAGRKADFFYLALFGMCFHFFFLTFFSRKETFYNRLLYKPGICIWWNFHKVKLLVTGYPSLPHQWVNTHCNIVAHQSHLWYSDSVVDTMFGLWLPVKPRVETTLLCSVKPHCLLVKNCLIKDNECFISIRQYDWLFHFNIACKTSIEIIPYRLYPACVQTLFLHSFPSRPLQAYRARATQFSLSYFLADLFAAVIHFCSHTELSQRCFYCCGIVDKFIADR